MDPASTATHSGILYIHSGCIAMIRFTIYGDLKESVVRVYSDPFQVTGEICIFSQRLYHLITKTDQVNVFSFPGTSSQDPGDC